MKYKTRSWSLVVAGIVAIAIAALAAPSSVGAQVGPFVASTEIDGTTVSVLVVNPGPEAVIATVKVVTFSGANVVVYHTQVDVAAGSASLASVATVAPADDAIAAIVQDGPDPF